MNVFDTSVNEGNITNKDRALRQLRNIVSTYNSKINFDDCTRVKTSKGNWRVECDGKKVCIVSKFILTDDIATELGFLEPDSDE